MVAPQLIKSNSICFFITLLSHHIVLLLLFGIVSQVVCRTFSGDVFSSPEALIELYRSENIVMGELKKFLKEMDLEHEFLERKKYEFEVAQWKAYENPRQYLSNPLNAFTMMRRLTIDWPIMSELTNRFNKAIKEEEIALPTESDLVSAALSLERLQNTYNLSTADLMRLNINGVQYEGVKLSPVDAYEIGRQLYGNGRFPRAIEWLEESLEAGMTESNYLVNGVYYMSYALYKMGYNQEAAERFKKLADLIMIKNNSTLDVTVERNNIQMLRKKRVYYSDEEDDENQHNEDIPNYRILCQGIEMRSTKETANLHCRYEFNNSPFLRIAPLKLEILNFKPYIAIYHNVIYDSEIETLKELARPDLSDSAVFNDGAYEKLTSRISKIQWLTEDSHPLLTTINERVKDMTALDVEYSEPLQIANYGLGGHYIPHYDWFGYRRNVPERDRIATLMFYMNDVEQGGGTAFTRAKVLVKPVKGTAALWYNLFLDGEGDENTFHGACPVLVGQKWAANKWIHEYNNEFKRKCDTVRDSVL